MDFDPNDRQQIEEALASPDPNNSIAVAVAARIQAMNGALNDAVGAAGAMPDEIVLSKPTRALEQVALELWLKELGNQVTVIFR